MNADYIKAMESAIYVVKNETEMADVLFDEKRDQAIYKHALSNAVSMLIDDIAIQGSGDADEIIIKLNTKYL